MYNNLNLDFVNINPFAKFSEILSVCFQDIEWKINYDGQTDRRTDGQNDTQPKSSIASLFSKWDITMSISAFEIPIFTFTM